eukprot:CAMPEP_0181033404 /NCGR_PEP_ID=MMETSP1070-20121207/7237_1 /TAXON_ID=265543 /ORGANISM="Minutocellus polymorphus, Strain NH13" /LENGTH=373 /DNA_ID=CAMNT_0023110825 /DNA_START=114 /DNA_END=1235 /DNA_ORIENTATION=+
MPINTLGHVQLAYPPAIIDDDYQYTFDGSCQHDSCDAFCGRTGPSPVPLTTVSPGPLNLTLNVNVKHPPFRYRVGLSSTSDAPSGFDSNILLDKIEAPGDGSTEFTVTVDIPDVKCEPFCTLQLFDSYYFVSCATLQISKANELASEGGVDFSNGGVDTSTSSNSSQQHNVPSEVTFSQEATNDGTVMINATVVLATNSWFAIAVSETGAMIGSQALIGVPNATSNGTSTSTQEFGLDGKFTEAIKPIIGAEKFVTLESSFDITEDSSGNYIHSLSATFNADVLCGAQLIWAHANSDGAIPTDELGYHGPYRGVLGTIVECPSQSHPAAAENGDSDPLQGRSQDDADDTSASSFRMPKATLGALLAVLVAVQS